jgi:D-lactate dehydrogenase
MKVAFFSFHAFDREPFERCNIAHGHELTFFEAALNVATAELAAGHPAVCAFVNDRLNREVLTRLHAGGTRLIALRSAGFNHVDREAARELGLTVARVPAYSPHSVAEHAVGLILALNRKIHRAYVRTREHNFRLEGLLGFDLHGKTVGLIGAGKIGSLVAQIMRGFGCEVLIFDPALPGVELDDVLTRSDVISLHCPLTPETFHMIDAVKLAQMKPGVLLVNTSRGGLLDSRALLGALKSGQLGGLALDVYEEEENFFFRDLSDQVIGDDVLARLLSFPNVLITAHQGFFTREALDNIASTTLENVSEFESGRPISEANRVGL